MNPEQESNNPDEPLNTPHQPGQTFSPNQTPSPAQQTPDPAQPVQQPPQPPNPQPVQQTQAPQVPQPTQAPQSPTPQGMAPPVSPGGPDTHKSKMKVVIFGAVALVVFLVATLLLLLNSDGSNNASQTTDENTSATSEEIVNQDEQISVGETVQLSNGAEFTFNSIDTNWTSDEGSSTFNKRDYKALNLTIKNNSSSETFRLGNFDIYGLASDGEKYRTVSYSYLDDDKVIQGEEVTPGESMTGEIVFDVTETPNLKGVYELVYTPTLGDGEDVTVKLTFNL